MHALTEESARARVAQAGATAFERAYLDCRLPVYRYLRTVAGSDDAAAELTAVAFERASLHSAICRPAVRSFHGFFGLPGTPPLTRRGAVALWPDSRSSRRTRSPRQRRHPRRTSS